MHITKDTIFYGPHECQRCGITIVRSSQESGELEFDNPSGPVYPNTVWQTHRCSGWRGPVGTPPPLESNTATAIGSGRTTNILDRR